MSVYRINLPDDYYYYGSTASSLKERMWCHKAHCKVYPERRLYQHIKSWDDITIELIETIDGDRTLRREREQYFMDYHRENGWVLLNVKEAGSNGRHNNDTKLKIGESNKIKLKGRKLSQEHIDNISKSLINNKRRLGTKVSDSTKEKMKNSHKGVRKSMTHIQNISNAKKKIIQQYDMENNLINEFNCANDAINYLDVKSAKHIRNCALGSKKSAYGFIWKYKN